MDFFFHLRAFYTFSGSGETALNKIDTSSLSRPQIHCDLKKCVFAGRPADSKQDPETFYLIVMGAVRKTAGRAGR